MTGSRVVGRPKGYTPPPRMPRSQRNGRSGRRLRRPWPGEPGSQACTRSLTAPRQAAGKGPGRDNGMRSLPMCRRSPRVWRAAPCLQHARYRRASVRCAACCAQGAAPKQGPSRAGAHRASACRHVHSRAQGVRSLSSRQPPCVRRGGGQRGGSGGGQVWVQQLPL
jgi:hypothetical protein